MEVKYNFQNKLAEIVKSQNKNSQFLGIVLNQDFVKFCQNITTCGQTKSYHFMLLFFHTVILRQNRFGRGNQVQNIYRYLLTLIKSSAQLSCWYLQQINSYYIKQFLIQSTKINKYICLGFIIQAIKVICQEDNKHRDIVLKAKINYQQNLGEGVKELKKIQRNVDEKYKEGNQLQSADTSIQENHKQYPKDNTSNKPQFILNQQTKIDSPKPPPKKSPQQFTPNKQYQQYQQIIDQQKIISSQQNCIDKLIPILMTCLNKKGMTPFAKIFTFLASIVKYKQKLQYYKYPQLVCSLLEKGPKIMPPIQHQPKQSYFGRQNTNCKQKQHFDPSKSFLIQSLRYFPGILSKQSILSLLCQQNSRCSIRALTFLLAQTSSTSEEVNQNLSRFEMKLKEGRKEDIQKYLFLIRYYYIQAHQRIISDEIENNLQLTQNIVTHIIIQKTICINNLTMMLKFYTNNYILIQLCIIQINKIATKILQFKNKWIQNVNHDQGLFLCLNRWLDQRLGVINHSRQAQLKNFINKDQKDNYIKRIMEIQNQRVSWMLPYEYKRYEKQQLYEIINDQQIYSELQATEVHKEIAIGVNTYRIQQKLGILTRVQNERGILKWAILQKNDVEMYEEL